ncbi:MAG: AbgT family transporter, partial [Cellvibrionales bacterium]|nr:AbgT family transporter [Cellvibrionales bacterium]
MASILHRIEHLGNKIPNPSLLFLCLCVFIIIISALSDALGIKGFNPVSQETLHAKSLLSAEGLRFMMTSMVTNFTQFAPVGTVLIAMLGLGIAEKSGLLDYWLTRIVEAANDQWLTFIVAFAGILSSMAADSGYVILLPLSALLFKSAGRPPIAGIATAFAGVSGGFGANLLVGPFDAILAGISTEALHLVEPGRDVSLTSNWYFAAFSSVLLAIIITTITELHYGNKTIKCSTNNHSSSEKTKGDTQYLFLASIIYITLLAILTLPQNAPLRNPLTGALDNSPFIHAIVIFIALYFAMVGVIFGLRNSTFNNATDVIHAMEDTLSSMGGYLVLMFFAAQFVAYFNWSQLGIIIATN